HFCLASPFTSVSPPACSTLARFPDPSLASPLRITFAAVSTTACVTVYSLPRCPYTCLLLCRPCLSSTMSLPCILNKSLQMDPLT
ncbi:hypothetical protein M9458_018942, partial [Cirrhinus mrigala]